MKVDDNILTKFGDSANLTGLFDLSSATMQQKLELLEALIKAHGEGETFIVVTDKAGASKMSLSLDTMATDIMA